MRYAITLALLALPAVPLLAEGGSASEEAKALVERLQSKHDGERIEALKEAARNQDKCLTSPIIKLLKDKSIAVRYAAIEALALRQEKTAKKKAANALAVRLSALGKDKKKALENTDELLKIVQALHDLAQVSTIKALLDIPSGSDREVARARAMAVGNVPDKEAIERLIQFGYKDRRGSDRTRDLAIAALRYATQANVKGGIEQWRKWWSENKKNFDPAVAADERAKKRQAQAEKEERKRKAREKKKNRKKKDGDS